ncbi:DUF1156 domain-containing protein [Desulfonema magnum]|uniref:SAM-depentend metyhlase domain-containing protein n=1 Tax=Desulfonema magnum TaxID=45655 RepID=A0A975BSS4_9BACT|nr:DUF1156 domain-containing protein [Desulfonema magnum]QTA90534.1 SAM-depentend metyhlase domain-containing protein [Desulfonema magnum]
MTKYIEKDFPIGIFSQLAERESWRKEIYRPPYYIHKWWAKRLGSVFRGIILAACENEDADILKDYYSKNCFSDVTVFDSFMGSGVTVGEAAKLGCMVMGQDINPVSAIIVQASLEKYEIAGVDKTFKTIERNIKKKIRSFYKTRSENGNIADVLYYFWVKTLNCPNCGKETDLFKSRIFSKNAMPKKDPSARAICPQCHNINQICYDNKQTTCSVCNTTYNPQNGNVNGALVTCPHCLFKFRLTDYLKKTNEPSYHKLYAKLVLSDDGTKKYEIPNDYDFKVLDDLRSEFESLNKKIPFIPIKEGYNTNQVLKHNYKFWHQMFSPRQLISVYHLCNEIKKISDYPLKRLFSCLLSGVLEFNNMFCSFKGEGTGAVRHMFSHHILRPEMMPIEANIWGTPKSSGSFSTLYKSRILRALNYKSDPFELKLKGNKGLKVPNINIPLNCNIVESYSDFKKNGASVYISYGDSAHTDIETGSVDLVITDPPFFDNVHYSQLADFFYYWLNQMLDISEDIRTTRHKAEVQDTDSDKFSEKLRGVFLECNRVLKNEGLLIFTYHHSKPEGWISVYKAIRQAGFTCIQSFPIKAEMSVSIPIQQAKIPIHLDLILVCGKSDSSGKIVDYDTKHILRKSVKKAKGQITELNKWGINTSSGDAKVAVMGRVLCELSQMADMEKEVKVLPDLENEVSLFVSDLRKLPAQKVKYHHRSEPDQLKLFESI